jgi:hypothetical protein
MLFIVELEKYQRTPEDITNNLNLLSCIEIVEYQHVKHLGS